MKSKSYIKNKILNVFSYSKIVSKVVVDLRVESYLSTSVFWKRSFYKRKKISFNCLEALDYFFYIF